MHVCEHVIFDVNACDLYVHSRVIRVLVSLKYHALKELCSIVSPNVLWRIGAISHAKLPSLVHGRTSETGDPGTRAVCLAWRGVSFTLRK